MSEHDDSVNHYNTECCGLPCPNSYEKPAQAFFAAIGAETRKAGFGDQARGWAANLLKRATEAGLYSPEEK